MKKPKLLLTGLSPDRINSNQRIRGAIKKGAQECDLFDEVYDYPVELIGSGDAPAADVVLAVGSAGSEEVDFDGLKRVSRRNNGRLIFWTHEDPYEFDFTRKIFGVPDLFITNERAAVEFYDGNQVKWLPLGADTTYFREVKEGNLWHDDLFFCGYIYPIRAHILNRIMTQMEQNFYLSIFGPNIDEITSVGSKRTLSSNELADYANRSLVTLNIGRDQPIANSTYLVPAETPGPRTFDVALSGSVQTIFNDGVAIEDFYEPGKEILLFDNVDDIVESVLRLRADPLLRYQIARAAQRVTLENHLYKHRIIEMMKWCL